MTTQTIAAVALFAFWTPYLTAAATEPSALQLTQSAPLSEPVRQAAPLSLATPLAWQHANSRLMPEEHSEHDHAAMDHSHHQMMDHSKHQMPADISLPDAKQTPSQSPVKKEQMDHTSHRMMDHSKHSATNSDAAHQQHGKATTSSALSTEKEQSHEHH